MQPSVRGHHRTDEEWIANLSAGGEQRDAALTDLRRSLETGLARAFGHKSAAPVEDFAQEALLRILDRLPAFRGDSRFLTWAMTVAVRVAVSEMRRARWRDVSLDEMVQAGRLAPPAAGTASSEDQVAAAQLSAVVTRVIAAELGPRQKQAIEAKLSGAQPDEIARRMGASRNAVYKLLHDARLRLKKAILEAGWKEEDLTALISRVR